MDRTTKCTETIYFTQVSQPHLTQSNKKPVPLYKSHSKKVVVLDHIPSVKISQLFNIKH